MLYFFKNIGAPFRDCQCVFTLVFNFALVLRAMGRLGRFQFMLQQFSWGHFLIASNVLSLLWYGFVVLVFYPKEFMGLFRAGGGWGCNG